MTIKVTQEHIDSGLRAVACLCPVALAMKDTTGDTWTVGCQKASAAGVSRITLPQPVRDFIVDFDVGNPVQPFDFDIPKPETV